MRIYFLSFKNVFENRWRSLTLGIFIFIATLLLVVFYSFSDAFKNNMLDSVSQSLSGDVQVRSTAAQGEDMFTVKGLWPETGKLDQAQLSWLDSEAAANPKVSETVRLVRANAFLSNGNGKESSMIIGIEPGSTMYKKSMALQSGRYLNQDGAHEIVLSASQADKLKAVVGDKITVQAQTETSSVKPVTLEVVGIGEIELLKTFAFIPAYVDLASAQELSQLSAGQATDYIVYLKDRGQAKQVAAQLTDKLKSSQLTEQGLQFSTWEKMGGMAISNVDLYVLIFYSFIGILLFVVGILIINMVFMMGLQRRQEIGTLRAIGFGRLHIIQVFMGEVLLITAIFFLLGAGCGLLINFIFSHVGLSMFAPLSNITGKIVYLQVNLVQLLPTLLVVFGIAAVASFYPSLKSASLQPVEALKEA